MVKINKKANRNLWKNQISRGANNLILKFNKILLENKEK